MYSELNRRNDSSLAFLYGRPCSRAPLPGAILSIAPSSTSISPGVISSETENNFLMKVLVRGGDDARVHGNGFGVAQGFDFIFLQNP